MTHLKCGVTDCVTNKDNCCCRPGIDVMGESACDCCETCCGSFQEKYSSGATNGAGFTAPNMSLEIKCQASTCVHNKTGKCTAKDVNITNGSNGTECETFRVQ